MMTTCGPTVDPTRGVLLDPRLIMVQVGKKHHQKTTRGFTIVELVTVIAIITILLGLSISAVVGIHNKAKRADLKKTG